MIMPDIEDIKVFISYTGRNEGRKVWEPVEKYLINTYNCQVIWGKEEYQNANTQDELCKKLVSEGNVALFFFTAESEGMAKELKYWLKKHNGSLQGNALLFKAKDVSANYIKNEAECSKCPPYGHINRENPWEDLGVIIPHINKLLFKALAQDSPENWERKIYKIIQEKHWYGGQEVFQKVRANIIKIAEDVRKIYKKDLLDWKFRFNWPKEASGMDAYSEEVDCIDVLEALLAPSTSASEHEIEEVFKALERVLNGQGKEDNQLPKKLSGKIVFEGVSRSTLIRVQNYDKIWLNYYEKNENYERRKNQYPPLSVSDENSYENIFMPYGILSQQSNYDKLNNIQHKILEIVSKICKYILCSTNQISVSHSSILTDENGKDFLAMASTANNTDKEQLSAVSEIPILTRVGEKYKWFGQKYRPPTSEYQSHWNYHETMTSNNISKNVLIHFHAVELLELYDKLIENDEDKLLNQPPGQEYIDEVLSAFRGQRLNLHVFTQKNISSRSKDFGRFLSEAAMRDVNINEDISVIWKPNHGIWLISEKDDDFVSLFSRVEKACTTAKLTVGNLLRR
jgi:hypothetical protein